MFSSRDVGEGFVKILVENALRISCAKSYWND